MKWVILVAKVTSTTSNNKRRPTSLPITPIQAIDGVPTDMLREQYSYIFWSQLLLNVKLLSSCAAFFISTKL